MGEKNTKGPRKSLRDELLDVDRQILKLLLKRHNLLEKLKSGGRVDPAEEKSVREAWQNECARVSRDPALSGKFFSLMKELTFLPRPVEKPEEAPVGSKRREAFNLAPPKKPVAIESRAPLDDRAVKRWLYLAAASGFPLTLAPCSQSDSLVDCVMGLDRIGAAISRNDDAITARPHAPMGTPDKVIHVGDDAFNFYLFLAHYLGKPSRAKFTGDARVKLADFSAVGRALPLLGARITHIVPGGFGLPLRVECSGILPAAFDAPPDLPAGFVEALIIAAPFYESAFGVAFGDHPRKTEIMARVLPILDQCGLAYEAGDYAVNLEPGFGALPPKPRVSVDCAVVAILLALASPLGGKVKLAGFWPDTPEESDFWRSLTVLGAPWSEENGHVFADSAYPIKKFDAADADLWRKIKPSRAPIPAALAACAALNGGRASLPPNFLREETTGDFLRACGVEADENGLLKPSEAGPNPTPWNAPSPEWAAALAITALSRRGNGFLLGNPGVMTELWPSFWGFYNSLPSPRLKKPVDDPIVPKRRRIRTNAEASLPEPRENEE